MTHPIKGRADYLALGDWNAICDLCGSKFKASQLRKAWDQSMRCPTCWEPRHPQEFVRGTQDVQTPPWTRPRGEDKLTYLCDLEGQSSITDLALADCSICGLENIFDTNPVSLSDNLISIEALNSITVSLLNQLLEAGSGADILSSLGASFTLSDSSAGTDIVCTTDGMSSTCDLAIADCSICDT